MDATTTGGFNASLGVHSLGSNTTGSYNTAIGNQALFANTTASNNTAVGQNALVTNTTGSENTAVGRLSLDANTTGTDNVAIGNSALGANTTASNNTAVGSAALLVATTGTRNAAFGHNAGEALTTANDNTLIGEAAGAYITTGNDSVCVGRLSAGYSTLLTTGTRCVFLGSYTTPSASNVSNEAVIGYGATGKGGNTTFLQGSGGSFNGANSSTFSTTSDRRIKKNIEDNNTGIDAINQIRVRNFEYRTEDEIVDFDNPRAAVVNKEGVQLGVIAQEIETILPDVVKEETTGVKTVDPSNLTWYLVNAVQELSTTVDELKAEIQTLKGE